MHGANPYYPRAFCAKRRRGWRVYRTCFLVDQNLVPGLPNDFDGLAKDHAATKELFDDEAKYAKKLSDN